MTIRSKLFLGLSLTALIIVLFGGTFYYAQQMYSRLQNQLSISREELKAWLVVDGHMSFMMKELLESLALEVKTNDTLMDALKVDQAESALTKLRNLLIEETPYLTESTRLEENQRLEETVHIYSEIKQSILRVWSLHQQGQPKTIVQNYYKMHIEGDGIDDKLHALLSMGVQTEDRSIENIEESFKDLNRELATVLFVLVGACFLTALTLMRQINLSILRSIQSARTALIQGISDLGSGKSDARVDLANKDELSAIAGAFNQMASDLHESKLVIAGQQQKMVTTSKMSALGEMAAGVAHEINNPLGIISTVAEQLDEVVQDEVLDRDLIRHLAGQVQSTVDRIAKIVSGLRSFSRDGSHDPMTRVNIVEVIKGTLNFCQERFRQHGIDLTLEGIEKEIFVVCRPTQIEQVVLNLLNNSHDAIAGLPEKWVKISLTEINDHLKIQVTDSGKGIPEEVAAKIFQPFFTTKEIGKGTGIGLSISSGIVGSHGGAITLIRENPNTCFVVQLPKNENDNGMVNPSKQAA